MNNALPIVPCDAGQTTARPERRVAFERQAARADAFYFQSRGTELFGWLHRPSGRYRDLALVICNPFGYESICAHRSLRCFAEAAAEIGVPALRFDFAGTGDSPDIDSDADQLAQWSQDVIAAVQAVRERTSVTSMCVLGVRLGATLAAIVANRCSDIGSLFLMAPIVTGRHCLRELRAMQVAGMLTAEGAALGAAQRLELNPPDGSMDVIGHRLSAATVRALETLDLTAHEPLATCETMILDDDRLPLAREWAGRLAQRGATVHYALATGYLELTMTPPHLSRVSACLLDSVRRWLIDRTTSAAPAWAAKAAQPDADDTVAASARGFGGRACAADGFVERPVFVDSQRELFGIVTEPPTGAKGARAVILLSVGADHHIGVSRVYVSLARLWARRGLLVLRFDLAGIGDSATRPLRRMDDILPAEALTDIRSAIDFVRNQYHIDHVTLAGICSGAYHALRAAIEGFPIRQLLLINPEQYRPLTAAKGRGMDIAEAIRNPHIYRRKVLSLQAWLKVLQGKVDIRRIPVLYARRVTIAIEAAVRHALRRLGLHLRNDLDRELREIAARGIHMTFLFSQGEPGLELLQLQAGSTLRDLSPHCRIHLIKSGDHTFARLGPRQTMIDTLTEELLRTAP